MKKDDPSISAARESANNRDGLIQPGSVRSFEMPRPKRSPVEELDAAMGALSRAIASGEFRLGEARALRGALGAVRGVRNLAHVPEALDRKRLAAGERA